MTPRFFSFLGTILICIYLRGLVYGNGENRDILDRVEALEALVSDLQRITCPTCPNQNWKQHGTSCYYFSTQILSWNNAQDYCQRFGGYLVEITSPVENFYIKTEIQRRYRHAYLNGEKVWGYWTGLKKINNQWLWVNSRAQLTYTNWNPGEPNYTGEECVHIPYHLNFNWNDYYCSAAEYFVCEKNVSHS